MVVHGRNAPAWWTSPSFFMEFIRNRELRQVHPRVSRGHHAACWRSWTLDHPSVPPQGRRTSMRLVRFQRHPCASTELAETIKASSACVALVRPRPTRCCRPCATSATSMKRTSSINAARPGSAKGWRCTRSTTRPASAASSARSLVPATPSSVSASKRTTSSFDRCIGCGTCVTACPKHSIHMVQPGEEERASV